MKKINFRKQVFVQNVQMDSSINFMTNGNINIVPCPWESDKEVTDGNRVKYRAGIQVDADGRTFVKRYNDGLRGPKHETLFETLHGAVKMTRPQVRPSTGQRRMDEEFVWITFKFPKKYPLWMIVENFVREVNQVMSFFNTRKEETVWNQQ